MISDDFRERILSGQSIVILSVKIFYFQVGSYAFSHEFSNLKRSWDCWLQVLESAHSSISTQVWASSFSKPAKHSQANPPLLFTHWEGFSKFWSLDDVLSLSGYHSWPCSQSERKFQASIWKPAWELFGLQVFWVGSAHSFTSICSQLKPFPSKPSLQTQLKPMSASEQNAFGSQLAWPVSHSLTRAVHWVPSPVNPSIHAHVKPFAAVSSVVQTPVPWAQLWVPSWHGSAGDGDTNQCIAAVCGYWQYQYFII